MRKSIGFFGGRRSAFACTALIGGLSIAGAANGALMLSFSDGTTTQYAPTASTSNGLSSTSLTTVLTFPNFRVDVASALSNATATSGQQGYLETNTIQVTDDNTQAVPVTLTITASDTGWTIPGSSGSLLLLGSSLGGSVTKLVNNGSDSVSFSSTLTTNGGATVQSTNPASQTASITTASSNPQGFNVPDASFQIQRIGTFNLSNVAVVSLTNSGDQFNISGTTSVTVVPEPTGLIAAVIGFSGLLFRRNRQCAV